MSGKPGTRRPRTPADDVSILMNRVTVTPSGCWEAGGYRINKGYARASVEGIGRMLAHRAAWTLRYGDPGPLCVLHRCDNPPCCNPRHLFLGTLGDNYVDMVTKGRRGYTGCPGERHHQAKLTEADVREIRRLYATGRHRQRDLARQFGVGQTQIQRIVTGESWSHVA